jgi:DNA-binding NarL/FixJ family response regulator
LIRVLLVDDHVSALEPLAFMLNHYDDMVVTATAASVGEARRCLTDDIEIDVAVLDLALPDGTGLDIVGFVHAACPGASVLILTAFSDQIRVAQAIAGGAAGVLNKSASVDEIATAIRKLDAGERLLTAQEVAEAFQLTADHQRRSQQRREVLDRLTERERDVLNQLIAGSSDKEIASCLSLSVSTVRTHVNNLLAKLGVSSRLHAVALVTGGDRHAG